MKHTKVSIVVPTYNSASTLEQCLKSIKSQLYQNVELVVVDNHSKDNTRQIAERFADKVFTKGPERSAQRNYGVEQSTGTYVFIIDSDMQLSETVVSDVVKVFESSDVSGVVIPEESFGEGFWAQCKKLERSFYVGVSWMEAARAFKRKDFIKLGGYDENLVSGEDWDFSQRIEKIGSLGRVDSFILHNEGALDLKDTLKKKYYYAQKFAAYKNKGGSNDNLAKQTGPIQRYGLYFSDPKKLFRKPVLGIGMLFMKTAEFAAGAVGLLKHANK